MPILAITSSTFTLICTARLSQQRAFDVPLLVMTTWTGPGQSKLSASDVIAVGNTSHESQLNATDSGEYSCAVTLDDNLNSSFVFLSAPVAESGKLVGNGHLTSWIFSY